MRQIHSLLRATASHAALPVGLTQEKTSLRANMQHSLQMWRLEQYTSTCVSRIIGRTPSELKVAAASHPSAQAEGRRKNQAFQFSPCTRFAEKLVKFVDIIASNTAMPHPPLGSFSRRNCTLSLRREGPALTTCYCVHCRFVSTPARNRPL